MAQYFLNLNQHARTFLINSTGENYEHLLLFRNRADNRSIRGQDRFYLGAYNLIRGHFCNIDLDPGNGELGLLTENCLELKMFNPRQNVFDDLPEFDLVYFPRNEIARMVNLQINSGGPNPRLYFTHSKVDYLRQLEDGVSNKIYQSISVLITSGTPDDPLNHEVATSIVQGVPCPPMWDEGKAKFKQLTLENTLNDVDVISCVELTGE